MAKYTIEDGVRDAVKRASREDACISVYLDGDDVVVRDSKAQAPALSSAAKLHAVAQRWDAKTIQVRYAGANSEWHLSVEEG